MKTIPFPLTSSKILEKIFSVNIVGAMDNKGIVIGGKRLRKPPPEIVYVGGMITRDRLSEQSR